MPDRGFEIEGFCVVRGPDLLRGGDIHYFHPPAGVFDGVIGGPPCQAFSRLRHIVEANGYQTAPNLIPEFERCVAEAQPTWFLMEHVPAAPMPRVSGYIVHSHVIDNNALGGDQGRDRAFSLGTPRGQMLIVPLEATRRPRQPTVTASGAGRSQPVKIGGSGKRKLRRGLR